MTQPGIDAVGALADPVRRALYEFTVEQDREVSRAEAAEATGTRRTLAGFHLDRLVEAGLLEVGLRKVSGRDGPGSGRPAKLYRRARGQLSVQLPPRDYETAAHVLAAAVERHGAEEALYAAAHEEGVRRGRERPARAGADPLAEAAERLREQGYEPASVAAERESGGVSDNGAAADPVVRLRNCPFHTLAETFPPLACGMNLELVRGLLEGAEIGGCTARMRAAPGRCCVEISKTVNIDMEEGS